MLLCSLQIKSLLAIFVWLSLPQSKQAQGTPKQKIILPTNTQFVAYDTSGERTYYSIKGYFQEHSATSRFPLQNQSLEYAPFSQDGKSVLLRCGETAYQLKLPTLELTKQFKTSFVWWEGNHIGSLQSNQYISPGRKSPPTQKHLELLANDAQGQYFLCAYLIKPGTRQNYGTPTYQLQLRRRTRQGKFSLIRHFVEKTYDPGSEGHPRRFECLQGRTAVFGYPNGGADNEDFIGVMRKGQSVAPLRDKRGYRLQFVQAPRRARSVIFGLAEAVKSNNQKTGEKYLYRVSETNVSLEALNSKTMFATLSRRHDKIELGVVSAQGVFLVNRPLNVNSTQLNSQSR